MGCTWQLSSLSPNPTTSSLAMRPITPFIHIYKVMLLSRRCFVSTPCNLPRTFIRPQLTCLSSLHSIRFSSPQKRPSSSPSSPLTPSARELG